MLKELIEITKPTRLELAKEIKKDVESRKGKVYLMKVKGRNSHQGKMLLYVVLREVEPADWKNGLNQKGKIQSVKIPSKKLLTI